jgi:GTPase
MIPVFTVSCVTGEGMPLLNQLLFQLARKDKGPVSQLDADVEYQIEDVFDVQGMFGWTTLSH